ncbi:MAG: HlyD family efflux transporter periplasmic adaptor subunit [Planctomycetaceae bacterium]|nr:HlyD family efflux transporter periplasmic adaptor subunit [Planctomycetaceae bacterium]
MTIRIPRNLLARVCSVVVLGFLLGHCPPMLLAQEAAAPATVKINGVFESAKSAELKITGEQTKSWVIKKIADHGTMVEANQDVLWLKTDVVDKQIRDSELELRIADMAMDEANFKFQQFLAGQEMDRAGVERAFQKAKVDYDQYLKVDRDYQLKSANFNLKFSEYSLENVQEELNQLEKMYQADELTEESEEIVLKRAKREVESAVFRLEGAREQHRRTIEESLPRNEIEQGERIKRAEMAYEAAKLDLKLSRVRREIELKKQSLKLEEQKENLEKLRAERKKFVMKAPVAGYVIHGALNRGAQPERPAPFEAGKSLVADQVVLTIVPVKPLRVRLSVSEAELRHVKTGVEVQVFSNVYPNEAMKGEVASVSVVPYSGSKFDCIVKFKPGKLAGRLIPTTGCRVEFPNVDPVSEAKPAAKTEKAAETTSPTPGVDASSAETMVPGTEASPATTENTAESIVTADPKVEVKREDPISGEWTGKVTVMGQEVATFEMSLELKDDDSVTGKLSSDGEEIPVQSGKFHRGENRLVLDVNTPVGPMTPEFKLDNGTLSATITSDQGITITLTATKK